MRRLTYALQFHRPPSAPGENEKPATAQSLRITTLVGSEGVTGRIEQLSGAKATLNNGFALSHDQTMFFEWGTITFGDAGNTLTFESIGAGYLLGNFDPSQKFSLGTVMWRVTGGTGFFAGATGAITSNFLIDLESKELIDNQLHIIYLR